MDAEHRESTFYPIEKALPPKRKKGGRAKK